MTKEMIKKGIQEGTISFEDSYGGCIELCCRIGENAFYFASPDVCYLSKDQFLAKYSMSEIVDMLFAVLENEQSAERYGINVDEFSYYEFLINYIH